MDIIPSFVISTYGVPLIRALFREAWAGVNDSIEVQGPSALLQFSETLADCMSDSTVQRPSTLFLASIGVIEGLFQPAALIRNIQRETWTGVSDSIYLVLFPTSIFLSFCYSSFLFYVIALSCFML